MVRLSYALMGAYPAGEMVELARVGDGLGFHACHFEDTPSSRDPWVVAAAAARATDAIRFGVSATHVYLREPTLIAQALATLDELSGGRAEAVVSFGDPAMLDAYHVAWRGRRPLARLREAIGVMRAYLDDGVVDHEGEFFHYTGVEAAVRPVQARLPLLVGALGGPRSFELAGEVADGVMCGSTAAANTAYAVEHVRQGARRAGRNPDRLQMGAFCITAVAEDPRAARQAARTVATAWLPSFPDGMVARHGLDPEELAPVTASLTTGDVAAALGGMSERAGDALTVAGTPEACAERLRADLVDPGIDHVVLAIVDPAVVEAVTGERPDGLPDAAEQLRLVSDRLAPRLPES